MARFIDPRVDWAFKRIFGSEDTKECLITFLNGLFEDELVIKDVTFAKTEKLGLRPDDRGVVFDVYCVTNEGKHVIVEMQKKEQEYFADRALYYTARAIVQQGVRGIWDYHLAPVYTVCFMDFVSESPMLKEFRTDLVLTDLQTRQRVSDRMRIVYLQLPLFDKHNHGVLLAWVREGNHERHGRERVALHAESFAVAQYPVLVEEVNEERRCRALVAIQEWMVLHYEVEKVGGLCLNGGI